MVTYIHNYLAENPSLGSKSESSDPVPKTNINPNAYIIHLQLPHVYKTQPKPPSHQPTENYTHKHNNKRQGREMPRRRREVYMHMYQTK